MPSSGGDGYQIRKSPLTGKRQVHYQCLACGEDLHNPLSDAGSTDECPACGAKFTVPGESVLVQSALKAQEDRKTRRAATIQPAESPAQRLEADLQQAKTQQGHAQKLWEKQTSEITAREWERIIKWGVVKGIWWYAITLLLLALIVGIVVGLFQAARWAHT
jgi:DNA-directed RNA polymerase subunit RPC12/RpoP